MNPFFRLVEVASQESQIREKLLECNDVDDIEAVAKSYGIKVSTEDLVNWWDEAERAENLEPWVEEVGTLVFLHNMQGVGKPSYSSWELKSMRNENRRRLGLD